MKTVNWVVGTIAVILIIVLTATNPRGPVPAYTSNTETRLSGVVAEVQEFYCPLSNDQGIHLLVQTDQGTRMIHVAPGRFLRSQGVRFQPGDRVDVSGSMVEYKGENVMIAREVSHGNELLTVREKSGKPIWE